MSPLLAFAIGQFRKEPETRIEDTYKWLFHATQGGEHAITGVEGPRAWLEREWKTLTVPMHGEPLVEPLRPDGKIVRLHLRPYRQRGGAPGPLLTAFVVSARQFRADRAAFTAVWHEWGDTLRKKPASRMLSAAEWERLERQTQPEDYPTIEHSRAYEGARHPAYRVLTRDQATHLVHGLR